MYVPTDYVECKDFPISGIPFHGTQTSKGLSGRLSGLGSIVAHVLVFWAYAVAMWKQMINKNAFQ